MKELGEGMLSVRAAYLVGALLLVSGLLHLAILTMGGGTWMGPLSLRKPTTFGLAIAAAGILALVAAGVIALIGVARSSARQRVATAFTSEGIAGHPANAQPHSRRV